MNIVKRSSGESCNSSMSLAIALNYFLVYDAHERHPFELVSWSLSPRHFVILPTLSNDYWLSDHVHI